MSYKLLFIALIGAALAACGNKGPLVLPDKAKQEQQDKDAAKKAAEPAPKQQ